MMGRRLADELVEAQDRLAAVVARLEDVKATREADGKRLGKRARGDAVELRRLAVRLADLLDGGNPSVSRETDDGKVGEDLDAAARRWLG